jgi:hypothetical protein
MQETGIGEGDADAMNLLTIRKHSRFAVRHGALVERAGGARAKAKGLLVELSLGGCRIASGSVDYFSIGDPVRVRVDGFDAISGQVRWAENGCFGLRFDRPLHTPMLQAMILACRSGGETRACA